MVDDLDRRLGQIDQAVEGAAKLGRSNIALSALEGSAALAGERAKAPSALARASVAAKERQADTEAASIPHAAKLFGIGGDSEKAIRLLIFTSTKLSTTVAAGFFNWNDCSSSIGTGGRHHVLRAGF